MSNRKHRTLVLVTTALLAVALMMAGCQEPPAETGNNVPSTAAPTTAAPVPTTAAPEPTESAGRTLYCEHCEQEILWTEWDKAFTLPTSEEGHYYLTTDVKISEQMNIETNGTFVLDLNGYTVTQTEEGKRIYSMRKDCEANLSIMDTSEAQTGKMVVSGDSANQGRVIFVEGPNHTLNLYSGTLDASAASGSIGLGICCQAENVTINMYGGTIIGGKNEGSGTTVRIDKAVFNMYGGTIKDGQGKNGGNLFVSKNGVFNMHDGVIEGGSSSDKAGNVSVGSDGVMFMFGGTIKNGTTAGIGGNVYVNASFTMEGGTIEAGTATNGGNNVYVVKTFTMTGGTLDTSEASLAKGEEATVNLPA